MSTALQTPAARGAAATVRRERTALWPLARVEGRRLLKNPLVVIGALGSAATFGALTWNHAPVLQRDDVLTAGSLSPLAVAVLIAASLAALRSRRHGTDELYDTTVTPGRGRVSALVLSCLWPAALGAAIVAAEVVALVWLRSVGKPDPLELLAGPIEVLLAGALGVALAKLVPSVAVGPVAVVAIGAIQIYLLYRLPGGTYHFSRSRWLAVWVPIASGLSPPREIVIRPIAWHLIYLSGLTLVATGVALVRTRAGRGPTTVAAGVALALVAGFVQTRQPTAAQEARLLALAVHPERFQVCRTADGVRYCAYPGYAGWIDRWAFVVNGVLKQIPPAQRPQALIVRQQFSNLYGGDLPRDTLDSSSVVDGGRAIEPGMDWGRGSIEGQYQLALALPVAARATGLPSTMHDVKLTPAEIDHLVNGSPPEEQAQLRAAFQRGDMLVSCSVAGEAREIVAIWLAAQSTPGAAKALRSVVAQDPYGIVVYRGNGTSGFGYTGPEQSEMSSIGYLLRLPTPVSWTKVAANYALQLLSRPRDRVAAELAANWDLLMRPTTSIEQLVHLLGLRPLLTLEQQLIAAGQDPSQAAALQHDGQPEDQIPCR